MRNFATQEGEKRAIRESTCEGTQSLDIEKETVRQQGPFRKINTLYHVMPMCGPESIHWGIYGELLES